MSVHWLWSMLHLLAIGAIPLLFVLASIVALDSVQEEWLTVIVAAAAIIAGSAVEIWLYYRFVPLVAHAA